MTKPKLLLGTCNPGKIREMAVLLRDVPFTIATPQDEGIDLQVEETGATFEENAILKVRAFAAASGLLTLADDSGLEVDALGGEPGPLSARYAVPNASDQEKTRYLLEKLQSIQWDRRGARFRSVIALAEPSGQIHLFEGVCEGVIALEPKGEDGFGYDPIFYVPAMGRHMAELSMEEKNLISHRGRATKKLVAYLKGVAKERAM